MSVVNSKDVQHSSRSKPQRYIIGCLLVAAAASVPFLYPWYRNRSVRVDPAILIANVPEGVETYQWAGENVIIYPLLTSQINAKLFRFDIKDSRLTSLGSVKIAQRKAEDGKYYDDKIYQDEDTASVSPDSIWAVLPTDGRHVYVDLRNVSSPVFPNGKFIHMGDLREIKYRIYHMRKDLVWLGDGDTSVATNIWNVHSEIETYSPLSRHKTIQRIRIDTPEDDIRLLGVLPDGATLLWLGGTTLGSISQSSNKLDTWELPTNYPGDIMDVVLSPDGTRIACRSYKWASKIRMYKGAFAYFKANYYYYPRGMNTLWVCGLHGEGARTIMHSEIPEPAMTSDDHKLHSESGYTDPEFAFTHYRWMPDGHHISFMHDNGIYKVVVDH